MAPFTQNPLLEGILCIRCAARWPVADYPRGCPACLEAGFPASVAAVYRAAPAGRPPPPRGGFARHAADLPYLTWPTLGEQPTPTEPLAAMADELDLAALWVKREGTLPTGSHKDRMSCLAVARAAAIGATTVVAASSGNAGASAAAYAAAAGLRCVVVTTPNMNPAWRRAIESTGATLVATRTSAERWRYVAQMVEREAWYPLTNFILPPVGSNAFGVEGYKMVAHELHEALGAAGADWILVPTARGDLLWGIAMGFAALRARGLIAAVPRLAAVEPFARLSRVLAGADYRGDFPGETAMVSIAGSTATFQALRALRDTDGTAVAVSSAEAEAARTRFAGLGLSVELSSAATLAALLRLRREDRIARRARVVLVATAAGSKGDGAEPTREIALVEPA